MLGCRRCDLRLWGVGANEGVLGGCRYQNSVGSARKVVRLLEEYGRGGIE